MLRLLASSTLCDIGFMCKKQLRRTSGTDDVPSARWVGGAARAKVPCMYVGICDKRRR